MRRYKVRPRFVAFAIVASVFAMTTMVLANQHPIVNRATIKALKVHSVEVYRAQFPKAQASPKREAVSMRQITRAYGVSKNTMENVLDYLPTAYEAIPSLRLLPMLLGIVATETGGTNGLYAYNTNGTWDGGIAQVNSVNWAQYGMDWYTVQNPVLNLHAAGQILTSDLRVANGSLLGAFMAYNEGPTAYQQGRPDSLYAEEALRYTKAFRFVMHHGILLAQ